MPSVKSIKKKISQIQTQLPACKLNFFAYSEVKRFDVEDADLLLGFFIIHKDENYLKRKK